MSRNFFILITMNHLVILFLTAFAYPAAIFGEPASRYKLTCEDYPCSEEDLTATKLVNNDYGKQFEKRLINNTYYPHPWYWVYKEKSNCKYTVAVREDMPTHMATMEWIDVDICKEIIKFKTH